MSHETESPAPPPGLPHDEAGDDLPFQRDTPGHVMSPGTRIPRPQTMVGIGSIPPPKGSVPPAPPTEVVPAPDVRHDPGSGPAIPKPRPSETMLGATSPLHTAEDANTQVNLTSLSPADAGRILAAAEADGRASPKRAPTLLSSTPGLPPPPPRRPSSFPAPAAPLERDPPPAKARSTSLAHPPPPATRSPMPAASAKRSSYPPPPPRRANTLLFEPGMTPSPAPAARAPVAGDGRSVRGSGEMRAVVHKPTTRPMPLQRDDVEELNDGLLMDDISEQKDLPVIPPQPISSSSLVEDPDSDPELLVDDDPRPALAPLASPRPVVAAPFPPPVASPLPPAPAPVPVVSSSPLFAPDPFAAPPAPSAPPTPSAPPVAPAPTPSAPPVAASPMSEPLSEPMVASDPFTRPTQPPRLRDLPPPTLSLPPPPRPVRPTWLVPLLALGGVAALLVFVSIVLLVVRSARGPVADTSHPTPHASAASAPSAQASVASSASAAPPVAAHAVAPASSSEAATGAPCVLAGAPHVVAPRALMRSGISVASTADRLALGVGVSEHEGFLVALDPSTFAVLGTSRPHASDTVHRVVPILGDTPSEMTSFLETTHKHATLEGAFPLVAEPSFVLGVAHGKLVWAPSRTSTPTHLWTLEGNAPVEALRAVPLASHAGFAVVFRQGGALFLGAIHADKTPYGALARIAGLGPQVGAPTLAAGTDHVVVAWADRASASVPWGIRWLKWKPGADAGEPQPLVLPTVAEGGAAMSPSLTSLTGGRFVLAWTEGAGAIHVVRAQALDAAERFVGTTLTVSADGVNAGEGTPVFTTDGRGAVVFFATPTGSTASVVAVPVICPGG